MRQGANREQAGQGGSRQGGAGLGKIEDAEAACEELRAALRDAGVMLPSLRVDTASYVDGYPLARIELGGCNAATARGIAAALGTVRGAGG